MQNFLISALCFPVLLCAQDLKEFEKNVTEFDLPNGMHFIVLERHQAPVVSFYAHVNSGSTDDPGGKSGLAHMLKIWLNLESILKTQNLLQSHRLSNPLLIFQDYFRGNDEVQTGFLLI